MFAALASALVICAAALVCGQAVLTLCGRARPSALAGPVGVAVLLTASGIAVDLGGREVAVMVTVVAITAAAAGLLLARRPAAAPAAVLQGMAAAALAAIFAAIPFIAAGRMGILGVGLVNDDMASHLLLADWVGSGFDPQPVLVRQGYPLGPHALMAGLSELLGADLIECFAGLLLAIAALTALVAFEALRGVRGLPRIAAAALVALPYMAAAYLAQEAFKEPIEALLLLGFALLLPLARDWRGAIPLALIAAGAVYAYSFPALFWLVGALAVWGGLAAIRERGGLAAALRRGPGTAPVRRVALAAVAGVALLLVLTAPDWGRIADFTSFRAFDASRANDGGLGNLRGYLSPLEALGVWPTSEFRLAPGEGSLPAAAFYLGALLGAAALALALPRWVRRNGWAVPGALAAAVVIYGGARAFGTVYTSAKALAIIAPLVALIALGGLLHRRTRHPFLVALAAAFGLAAALSSFLVLRQAPVGPQSHMDELAQIRPIVEGRRLLFLGRDNFVLYELRGSRPFTHVRNFYDPFFVRPNFEIEQVASKFDFDALTPAKLARFPYVLTTRAAYASGPPPGYSPAVRTTSYVLWRRGADRAQVLARRAVERGPQPGRRLRCGERGGGRAAVFSQAPVGPVSRWTPSPTLESGGSAAITLELPRGRWNLSLQYDSTRPVTLSAPGFEATVPGNLDYRGVAPYWPAGTITVRAGGGVTLRAEVEQPPLAGRLLGAHSVAHLGALAATPSGPGYARGAPSPAPGDGERLVPARRACGRYTDWRASAGR